MIRSTVFVVLALGLLVTRVDVIGDEKALDGVCEKDGHMIVGERPITIDKRTPMPRKRRHVATKYPDWPSDLVGSGGWMGEMLVDKQGRVARVWTTRDMKFNRPFPLFTQAIVDAMMQWVYEPLLVETRPTPFCVRVTMSVNWS
jgi:hypothetical protein